MRTVWLSADGEPVGQAMADLILATLERAAEPIRRLLDDPSAPKPDESVRAAVGQPVGG
jgi:hypothetical protein